MDQPYLLKRQGQHRPWNSYKPLGRELGETDEDDPEELPVQKKDLTCWVSTGFFFFPPQRTGRDTREEKPGLKKKPGPYTHLPGSNLETRPMSSDNKALWHPVS